MDVIVWIMLTVLCFSQEAAGATCSEVTAGGALACDDACNEAGVCLPSGAWLPSLNCLQAGTVCRGGACVTADSQAGREYCNDVYKTLCVEAGVFPSPPDCTHYYICLIPNIQVNPSQCGGGTAFDAATGSCSAALQSGACPAGSSVEPCASAGEVGIAPGNDRQYYTCQLVNGALQTVWRTCPDGYRFSVTARACQYVGSVGSGTVCADAAPVPGSLPLASSRCSFVWCYSRSDFEVRSCRSGWYYDHSERGCVYGGSGGVVC